MKTETYKSMGLDWPISIPESVKEFDDLAKKEGACLAAAIDHEIYHVTLGDIRRVFTRELDALLSSDKPEDAATRTANGLPSTPIVISWDHPTKKDEDGAAVELNEGEWYNRVKAEMNKTEKDFAFLVPVVSAKVKFDPEVKPRQPAAPKKTPKASLEAAAQILFLHGKSVEEVKEKHGLNLAAPVDVEQFTAKMLALNPDFKESRQNAESGLPSQEWLAKLITVNEARKRAEVKLSTRVLTDVGLAA